MKQTPLEAKIQERLKPGVITLEGFLGDDQRHYHEIIAEDLEVLKKLGKMKEEIAERMDYFTGKAFAFADEETSIDDTYRVQYQTERGRMISPFMDRGMFPKGTISLTNTTNSISITWTPLALHLIGKYGFFQGKGAKFRIDPSTLIKAIF